MSIWLRGLSVSILAIAALLSVNTGLSFSAQAKPPGAPVNWVLPLLAGDNSRRSRMITGYPAVGNWRSIG